MKKILSIIGAASLLLIAAPQFLSAKDASKEDKKILLEKQEAQKEAGADKKVDGNPEDNNGSSEPKKEA